MRSPVPVSTCVVTWDREPLSEARGVGLQRQRGCGSIGGGPRTIASAEQQRRGIGMAARMWWMAAALAATAVTVHAEPAPDQAARRLALAKVWLEVKVAHPAVARGQVDPDAAMPAAIAKVDAATTKEAYAAAIKDLLAPLHDPVTFVEDTSAAPAPPAINAGWIEHPAPKIAVVTPLALATEPPAKRGELVAKLPAELDGAEVIVVDLRAPGMEALVFN